MNIELTIEKDKHETDVPEEVLTAETGLNRILKQLEAIQAEIAEYSDALDSDKLEEAEADLDLVIERIIDVMEDLELEVE